MSRTASLIAINPQANDQETANILATTEALKDHLGEIHLLSVLSEGLQSSWASSFSALADSPDEFNESFTERERDALEVRVQPYLQQAQCHAAFGIPSQQITKLAATLDAELIVMGTRSRRGLGLLLGSTSQAVLNHLDTDLLAVRGSGKAGYQRVLIALDPTPMGGLILEKAVKFGLHVDQCRVVSVAPRVGTTSAVSPMREAVRHPAADEQQHLIDQHRLALLEILEASGFKNAPTAITTEADIAGSIMAKALEMQADLIVLGLNNRSALQRKLLGSTTSAILDKASCDVYVVRNSLAE